MNIDGGTRASVSPTRTTGRIAAEKVGWTPVLTTIWIGSMTKCERGVSRVSGCGAMLMGSRAPMMWPEVRAETGMTIRQGMPRGRNKDDDDRPALSSLPMMKKRVGVPAARFHGLGLAGFSVGSHRVAPSADLRLGVWSGRQA